MAIFGIDFGFVGDAAAMALSVDLHVTGIRTRDFPPPEGSRAKVALTMFNDTIQRAALAVGARIVELRDISTEHEDFVNAIEPSARGGAKIAHALPRR